MTGLKAEVIDEYNVGISNIKIIKYGNSYQYVVEEFLGKDVEELVLRNMDKILTSIPYNCELNDLILSKAVSEVLGISNEDFISVLYVLRKELKYKKFQVLIDDPYIEDITVVGPGPIWVRHSKVLRIDPEADYIPTNIVLSDVEEVLRYINLFSEKAGKIISKSYPILDANLPDVDGGHRVHLVLPEVSLDRPEITIRKKRNYGGISLNSLISEGTLPRALVKYINAVIRSRGSIVILGPPGSGKTTLLRAILYECIPQTWKIVIIEDTPEIDPPPKSNWVRYIVPTSTAPNNFLDQFTLSKAALRASVSRYIVIGETRGSEAQVLVQAMNMGLGGLCLPKDQLVLAKVDGKVDLYEIGDVVEGVINGKYKHVEVVTGDVKGVARWVPISRAIIKDGSRRFVRIHVSGGVVHEVHEEHSVIVYEKGKSITKPAKDLKPGDILISLPHPPQLGPTTMRYVITMDYLEDDYKRSLVICDKSETQSKCMSAKDADAILRGREYDGRKLKDLVIHANTSSQEPPFPYIVKLSKDLGYLIGSFLVSGDVEHDEYGIPVRVTFNMSVDASWKQKKILHALEELGLKDAISIYDSGNVARILIRSSIFTRFLVGLLDGRVHEHNRCVPLDLALRAPEDFRVGIIEGYFDAGAIRTRKGSGITVKTANRRLAESLYLILRSLGIVADVRLRKRGCSVNGGATYLIHIRGGEYEQKAFEILDLLDNVDNIAYMNYANIKMHGKPKHDKGLRGKLLLLRVKKVEVVEKESLLYDIEVPETHIYAISGSLILTHNTTFHGGNVKEALMRLTGPPINLSPYQVSMFWTFITVNYVYHGKSLKRAVVSVDEPIYDEETDSIVLNNLYTFGDEVTEEELFRKSVKVRGFNSPNKDITSNRI